MSDVDVLLPPDRSTILPNEGGMSGRLGAPLGRRPLDVPVIIGDGKTPEIVVDISGGPGTDRMEVGSDGSVTMKAPAVHGTGTQDESQDFGENLAESLVGTDMSMLASEIVEGVDADMMSRSSWIDQFTKGIDLLGLKNEEPGQAGTGQRGVSRVGHPLMIEAMIKYQASAEGELLPAAGPAKVATIGKVSTEEQDRADNFADDLNYFLTEVAPEYYPDTAGMLMNQAYCGIGYKKIMRDPIKRRPTSLSILAPDLIVSEEATDLDTALRVTHRIEMLRGQLRRMQLVGAYRDIDIGMPTGETGIGRQAQRAINLAVGISPLAQRPQDAPHEILECDTDIDIDQYSIMGYYERHSPDGLPLPYKVTVDRSSREVLGIWRNWRPNDPLYTKRNMYVKFGMVPGLGFHNWGFLQLLGNQTRALRSCWRLLIDAGMFSNFPGGIKLAGARTSTNEIAPRPGEWVDIDLKGLGPNPDIKKIAMAMPYNPPNPAFVQLIEIIKADAQKLGATVQIDVGEGRSNVPVGTILSLIEQQIQVISAVNKRNHRAQKQELNGLRELFAENPDDLNRLCRDRPCAENRSRIIWEKADEFTDLNLVPASDPNVPTQVHRMMMANVLVMLMQQAPQLFDVLEGAKYVIRTIGLDPDRFVVKPSQGGAQQQPDPKVTAKQIEAAQKIQTANIEAQTEAQKIDLEKQKLAAETTAAAAQNETTRQVAQSKVSGDVAKENIRGNNDRAGAIEQIHHQGNVDSALADQQAGHDSHLAGQQAGHDAAAENQKQMADALAGAMNGHTNDAG